MDDQDTTNKDIDETTQQPVEETPAQEQAQDEQNSPEVNLDDSPKAEADADAAEEATTSESADKQSLPSDDSEGQSISESEETPDTTEAPTNSPTDTPTTPGRWYVVHTYSGHENKVATQLKQRVESEHLENKIFDVLVPTQDKIEIRGGKKASVKEKIFPGYILVKMDLDDAAWLAVRTTQGVTSFVGIGNRPTPVPDHEVASIIQFMTQGAAPTFKDVFLVDDTVKIIDGPFADFIGKVESVDKEKGKVRVLVSIFGRETPVELDFLQVTKL